MRKKFGGGPSAALVISIVALVLAASGTAVAASKLVSGNSLIRKNSLSGNRLVNGSVTGKQIAISTLGKVPSAAKADVAASATTATTATTAGSAAISSVTYVTATGSVPLTTTAPTLLTASCPAGTTVIGGGADVGDEVDGDMNDSYPNGTGGWSANFVNQTSDTPITATVTAICAPAAATKGS